jgi:hypothetical protein
MDNVVNEALIPCKDCGRNFREEALVKHAKICKKVFKSKRKKFDTKKKRIIDSEHAMLIRYADKAENNPKLKQVRERKKNNWKIQSEILRKAAQASRQISYSGGGGGNRGYNQKGSTRVQTNYGKSTGMNMGSVAKNTVNKPIGSNYDLGVASIGMGKKLLI